MTIHYPPHYRYALYEAWDKEAFEFIKQIAKTKKYPRISGTHDDKNQFLIMLIRTQKSLHEWRQFLSDTLDQARGGVINTKFLNQKYPPDSISKDIPAWVTYEEDRLVSDFIDELETRKIDFQGTDDEISEFVVRFILGQLGHDWESTIIMIWEMLGDSDKLNIKELNQEMRNFDYLKLFETF